MIKYAINLDKKDIALARGYDINSSYKDLCAVCDAIRYLRADRATEVLDAVIGMKMPIPFYRYNKYMGSRHELGGQKGAYPVKAAKEAKTVLLNAIANSKTKGLLGITADSLYIVHASANKTRIERRKPSKGSLSWGRGKYGMSSGTHSDIEYAKLEIGVAESEAGALTKNMKYFIRIRNPTKEIKTKQQPKQRAKEKEKVAVKPAPQAQVQK